MAWCEAEGVAYLFGLAPNARLKAVLAPEAWEAARLCRTTGKAARLFRDFAYQTETSWSHRGGLWARPSTCPTVPIRVSW